MKVLAILSVVAVCASAAPQYWWPGAYPLYAASQYHAQDGLGAASYGYSIPNQASTTFRDHFGNVVGSYAYIGADGKENRVQYVADSQGFRVISNNLPTAPEANLVAPVFEGKAPEPVQDTADVAAAKAEFFRLYKEAEAAAAATPENDFVAPVFDGKAPEPVQDTAEVAAAKAEFFRLYKEAEAAAAAAPERKKRQVLFAPAPIALPAYAKTTLKTNYFEKDEVAKTPAATTLINLKEKEQDFITPIGYNFAYTAPVAIKAPEVKTLPVYSYAPFSYVF